MPDRTSKGTAADSLRCHLTAKLQKPRAMHRLKVASTGSSELAPSSLTSLCLVAGVLLAGALPGALHYFL
jgi:hypothetical protein